MKDDIVTAMVTIATAIVGLAILSVLVSPRARTSSVLAAAGQAFATSIGAATAPVTGASMGGGGGLGMPSLGAVGGFDFNNFGFPQM